MSRAIIEAHGLGKRYTLGEGHSNNLRESLGRWLRQGPRRGAQEFWAIDDVSFSVTPGEAIGVIGRNGAGKSTLLKILSRITSPTRGHVCLRGRVAALLEVGTGFHSELTGRENIFLNGAIMGMSRAEIRRSFDEIVEFSQIERFLDTPVKRYSSGMYVRLAFAVAAHLRPEILVVDEVLAVGDASFQKKCLGKMQDVASGGRTVLFVSHNMAAVTRLCSRALLLDAGKVVADGRIDEVVAKYIAGSTGASPVEIDYAARGRTPGNEHARLLAVRIVAPEMDSAVIDIRSPLRIEIDYEALQSTLEAHCYLELHSEDGTCVFACNDSTDPATRAPRSPGRYRASVEIPGNTFAEGMYSVDVGMSTFEPATVHFMERGAMAFQVNEPGDGSTARGTYMGVLPGVLRPLLPWSTITLRGEEA